MEEQQPSYPFSCLVSLVILSLLFSTFFYQQYISVQRTPSCKHCTNSKCRLVNFTELKVLILLILLSPLSSLFSSLDSHLIIREEGVGLPAHADEVSYCKKGAPMISS